MTEVFAIDERVEGHETVPALARVLTTGPLLRRIEENTTARAAANEFRAGSGYDSNIVSVELLGDRATVVDCSQDRGELYDADGTLVFPPDDFFKLRRSSLVLIDGRWLVEEIYAGGDERCDPEDFQ
ncbi:MAG: hypothetical protein GY724_03395 [Actinomycetia bacterium]|nr:hypothetical protein [Actinomycetes bacterium]MCP4958441.1 hypothetical protein [Actinomycetes bacterium]